jgi:hypothetical protein
MPQKGRLGLLDSSQENARQKNIREILFSFCSNASNPDGTG